MADPRQLLNTHTFEGEVVSVGDVTIKPQSQAVVLRWPFGGFVWNRPTSVIVERDGHTQRIPVLDVTRLAILAMLGLGVVYFIISMSASARRRRNQHG